MTMTTIKTNENLILIMCSIVLELIYIDVFRTKTFWPKLPNTKFVWNMAVLGMFTIGYTLTSPIVGTPIREASKEPDDMVEQGW